MKLLTTASEIRSTIEIICETAREELALVSPFIKFSAREEGSWDKLQAILGRISKTLETFIIITKPTSHFQYRNSTRYFQDLGAHFFTLDHLHSKIYLNENCALFTSMNLYFFSAQNNYETGVLIEKTDEIELRKAKDHVNELLDKAIKYKY